ncbi:unnamed protein product, partial [Rotaria magnacalcarata]
MSNGVARTSSTTTTTTNSIRPNRHSTTPPKAATTVASSYFPITVLYDDKFGKSIPYELVLKSNATIADMKKEIEHVTNLPIRQQSWTGLSGAKDTDQLRHTSISRKAHLSVRKLDSSSSSSSSSS